MKVIKTLLTLLGVWGLLLFAGTPVMAYESLDMQTKRSLTIKVHDGNIPVPGGELTIYQVGTITGSSEDPAFALLEGYKDSGANLNLVNDSSTAKTLLNYIQRKGIQGKVHSVGSDATVTYPDLELGLYLVIQNKAADGYEAMAPFLISVPNYSETTGRYSYQVNAYPKADLVRKPPKRTPGVDLPDDKVPPTPPHTNITTNTTTNIIRRQNIFDEIIHHTNVVNEKTTTNTTKTTQSVHTSFFSSWQIQAGLMIVSLTGILCLCSKYKTSKKTHS